jgi:hypothetical protein
MGQAMAQQDLGATVGLDWSTWQPGNAAAAALVDPQGRLADLLNGNKALIDQLDATTLDRIGTALASGLDQGLSPRDIASEINDVLNDPLRAMVIARTETSNALNQAAISDYKDAGIEQIEWQGADPCEICEPNDGEIITLGDTFSSGDEYPPAHPNCICTTLPVIPESGVDTTDTTDQTDNTDTSGDVTEVSPEGEDTVIHDGIVDESPTVETETFEQATAREWKPGEWVKADETQVKEIFYDYLKNTYGFTKMRSDIEAVMNKVIAEKGAPTVYANGGMKVTFERYGLNEIKEFSIADQMKLMKYVDELQKIQPKESINVVVAPLRNSSGIGVKAWTHSGGDTIFFSPSAFADVKFNETERFMPVSKEIEKWKYTLTHEWGHTIDTKESDTFAIKERNQRMRDVINQSKGALRSQYARENTFELYAEMFAEWHLSKGLTENKLAIGLAKEFGWK